MQTVDFFAEFGLVREIGLVTDIAVEFSVGKSEIFLVRVTAQTIDRNFMYEFVRQTESFADLSYLCNGEVGKGRKVSCRIAVLGGIADPVL